MNIKQTLAATLTICAAVLSITSCSDNDYQPIYLLNAEDNTEITETNLNIDAFSEGEKFLIEGGKGNYTVSVTNKKVLDFRYDGDTLTLYPLSTGISEALIADRSGNSLMLNITVKNPQVELTVLNIDAEVQGDDLTQAETKELQKKISTEGVTGTRGRFVFTFSDKGHTEGDVKIYPETSGNYCVGIFNRMTKYDENTGDSYACIEIRMAGGANEEYTFNITESNGQYIFYENVTSQYQGVYPALSVATRIYTLEKVVG